MYIKKTLDKKYKINNLYFKFSDVKKENVKC